jgi:hypothetical protein
LKNLSKTFRALSAARTANRALLVALFLWLTVFCNASAATTLNVADPVSFFTTIADKALRSTFSFGISNIPVQSNGVFVYSPAVQRLLQLSANVYDATTTNFYPIVFRPVFNRGSSGDVFIAGYQQVVSVNGVADPQLAEPIEVGALSFGTSSNVNVYGVPWIIGAKKGLPNFNQFVMRNDVAVTRKLQMIRKKVEAFNNTTYNDFQTNQMFVMSITNHVGFSFWNSYSSNYAGGDLHVFVRDIMGMSLTNGALNRNLAGFFVTNIFIPASVPWPGSAWDLSEYPASRQAAPESFVSGRFDLAFLPESVYQFSTATFIPISTSPQFETGIALTILPQFGLMTTNWLQAFILDGTNVIDYVQFNALASSRDLNNELKDNFQGVNNSPYRMWYTNAYNSIANPPVPTLGMVNQLMVSRTGSGAPYPNAWKAPPNMPPGLAHTPGGEAAFFNAFFTGQPFNYPSGSPITFTNLELTNQVPYTPTRIVYDYTVWQANDPLVHYLSTDLKSASSRSGKHAIDDPNTQSVPFESQSTVALRYQPWGRGQELAGLNSVDKNVFNLAYRDPLVWGSDDWNFPSGPGLPLNNIGRVHRGTPWQTVYLKATNILSFNKTTAPPANGFLTWMSWTGNGDAAAAVLTAPTHDWRLVELFVSLFNTNDPTQLQSVNDTNRTDLLNVLNNITVQTNSSADVYSDVTPQFDSLVMSSNSPQALLIANAIGQTKAGQPGQMFNSLGDILATPELALISPWLNTSDQTQLDYGISDEAYEAIPAQLLPRLRTDSIGSITQSNDVWSIQFTGSEAFAYILETSTNLLNWEILSTNIPAEGVFSSPILPSSNTANRFYRSVLLP